MNAGGDGGAKDTRQKKLPLDTAIPAKAALSARAPLPENAMEE